MIPGATERVGTCRWVAFNSHVLNTARPNMFLIHRLEENEGWLLVFHEETAMSGTSFYRDI